MNPLEIFYTINRNCPCCQEWKVLTDFHFHNLHNDYTGLCKVCHPEPPRQFTELQIKIMRLIDRYLLKYGLKDNRIKQLLNKFHSDTMGIKKQFKPRRKPILQLKPERAKVREYIKNYHKNNPRAKIAGNMRTRLKRALKSQRTNKNNNTFNYVGCSPEKLKNHIESLWLPGMSWDNYSYDGWHMGHIIPCNAFDLTKEENVYLCFHYTNLRPEWSVDNLANSDKMPNGKRVRELRKHENFTYYLS